MSFQVIEAGPALAGGYVLPAGETPAGDAPVALPYGADGRTAECGADGAPPVTQPPWGWGLAPARLARGEDAGAALTELPENPSFYTARQQDAVRRDVAPGIGDYMAYQPEPFAGTP